ncbi:MAG TPA: nucleotidyltransferase family protein, partial [Methanobacterium sp.]
DILKKHDITGIAYKGPLLTYLVYGNLAFRQFDDIDIFVFPGDVLKTKEVLISEGYHSQFSFNPSMEKFYLKSEREFLFSTKDNNINLEIHWKSSALSYSFPDDGKILGGPQNLEEVSFHGFKILNIKPEDLLLILCMHCAIHFWDHLGRICDISEFIGKYKSMDWDKVIDKAKKLEIERILSINLFLAHDLLGSELPDYFLQMKSDKDLKNLVLFIKKDIFGGVDSSFRNIKRFIFRYKTREGKMSGIKDIILILTAPTREEFKVFKLPASLHLFYYLIRPFNLIKKIFY